MFKAFRLTAAAAVTAAALISGCSLAPDYERPSMPEGAFWSGDTAAGIPDWQKQFSSAELSRLIDQALKTNRDLKLAILNVAAYEAKYRITRADLLPSLNGAAGSTRSKVSDSQSNMTNIYSTQYNVGLNVGWELDFFGKIRNQKEAAVEQYLAEQENRKSAQMSIIAAVADAYYTLVADRNLLEISKRTLKTEEESSALVKQQLDSGAVSDLTYVQAQTAVDQARINTANYERLVSIDLSSLSVLVGAEIPSDTGSSVSLLDLSLPAFPVAAPSSLLERRPDIMAAEHNLRAANASIGAARAAFFPSISLNAGVGSISPEMNSLPKYRRIGVAANRARWISPIPLVITYICGYRTESIRQTSAASGMRSDCLPSAATYASRISSGVTILWSFGSVCRYHASHWRNRSTFSFSAVISPRSSFFHRPSLI